MQNSDRDRRIISALALFLPLFIAALLYSPFAAGAEMVENPRYRSWARFKPGSMVTLKGKTVVPTEKKVITVETVTTYLLKEVTPGSVVVELKTTSVSDGKKTVSPVTKLTYRAKLEREAMYRENPSLAPGTVTREEGSEKITIKGKSFILKKTTYLISQGQRKTKLTMWTSSQIPGNNVKLKSESGMVKAPKMTIESEVVDFKIK
jgi:hypothetical protein